MHRYPIEGSPPCFYFLIRRPCLLLHRTPPSCCVSLYGRRAPRFAFFFQCFLFCAPLTPFGFFRLAQPVLQNVPYPPILFRHFLHEAVDHWSLVVFFFPPDALHRARCDLTLLPFSADWNVRPSHPPRHCILNLTRPRQDSFVLSSPSVNSGR